MSDKVIMAAVVLTLMLAAWQFGFLMGQGQWPQAATTWERLYHDADDDLQRVKSRLRDCEAKP